MGWANKYIETLKQGNKAIFRPHGNSMQPRIESGQLITVAPLEGDVEVGDIVLCKVNGKQFLHLVTAKKGTQYRISNNKGYINGWTNLRNIYGKVIKVEP